MGLRKSLAADSRNAQASKTTKPGAANFCHDAQGATLGQPPKQVAAGKLDPNKALNMFFQKAASLTAKTSDALLIAAGSALDIRHSTMDVNGHLRNVSNVLTAGSLGIDSLHHFAFAAFNVVDNWWAPAGALANFMDNHEDGPPYSRADGSDRDVVANEAGAHWGQKLFWHSENPLNPSAEIPYGEKQLRDIEQTAAESEKGPHVIK